MGQKKRAVFAVQGRWIYYSLNVLVKAGDLLKKTRVEYNKELT